MATRWGAVEKSVIAGSTECLSAYALDEDAPGREDIGALSLSDPLDAGPLLEALPACLDSSILSIFEDSCVPVETNGRIDEEGEAALLTALTEVLDSVDSENLSPFDTLPDSELFSGPKGRDASPLRRLLSLARSPPEKDPMCFLKSSSSRGNEVDVCVERHWRARLLSESSQRSDGEEEDGDTGSLAQGLEGDLGLPSLDVVELGQLLSAEQASALALGDLVKHVYPYCLAVSLELGEDNSSPLPEGGIVLEVVDRGEQGEPILAVTGPVGQAGASEEEPVSEGKYSQPGCLDYAPTTEDGGSKASEERPKEPASGKCPSRRKKKRKSRRGTEKGVARSGQSGAAASALPPVPEGVLQDTTPKAAAKKRVTFAPVLTSVLDTPSEGQDDSVCETSVSHTPEEVPPVQPTGPAQQAGAASAVEQPSPQEEARPKPLSLQEYWLLRQQRQPAPVGKPAGNIKWPTLPELPRELPPIPCLPEQRWTPPVQKEPQEAGPAWHPVGSSIPPTPEALLVPPGSAVGSRKPPGGSLTAPSQALSQPTGPAPPAASPSAAARPVPPQPDASHPPPSPPTTVSHPPQATSDPRRLQPPDVPASSGPLSQIDPAAAPASRVDGLPPSIVDDRPGPAASLPARGRPQRTPQTKLLVQPAKRNPEEKQVQASTSEIGIEATDLTSLLEQFEETQAKEEHTVPEVSGRAAAVGNSGKPRERTAVPDLASTAGLTPPATPPHQTWKPLTPVALLGKPKPSPTKAIQIINPRPLPPSKARSKPPATAPTHHPAFADHDYCRPSEGPAPAESGSAACVPQHTAVADLPARGAISTQAPSTEPLDHRTQTPPVVGTVLLSPEASPSRAEPTLAPREVGLPKSRSSVQCPPGHPERPAVRERGRPQRRYRARSPSPASSSSSQSSSCSSSESRSRSRSTSPPRKRFCSRSRRSGSSSSSSSRSSSGSLSCSPPRRRCGSYSSSRSCSRSRSRSRSPCWRRTSHSPNYRHTYRYNSRERLQTQDVKDRKQKAIEERRVVYVGKIRGGMTRKELKERFSLYGEIEDCTLHFREHGDNYGFVTYYNTKDAFNAIENGGKLRQCNELPFDLCFGGRRQFCKSNYADLDSSREYDPAPAKSKYDALDFDTLLRQAQKGQKR